MMRKLLTLSLVLGLAGATTACQEETAEEQVIDELEEGLDAAEDSMEEILDEAEEAAESEELTPVPADTAGT